MTSTAVSTPDAMGVIRDHYADSGDEAPDMSHYEVTDTPQLVAMSVRMHVTEREKFELKFAAQLLGKGLGRFVRDCALAEAREVLEARAERVRAEEASDA